MHRFRLDHVRFPVARLSGAGQWGAALLALYLFGVLFIAKPHYHAHDVPADVHYDQCAEDPCHAAVYHFDRSGGCRHKAHLSRSFGDDCPWCGVTLQRHDLPPGRPAFAAVKASNLHPVTGPVALVPADGPIPAGRGPPAA